MRTGRRRHRIPERRRDRGGNRVGQQHAVLGVEVHPSVAQRRMQSAHPGDVVCHASHLREFVKTTNRQRPMGAQSHVGSAGPSHLGSHTSAVSLALGVLLAVLLLGAPGAAGARGARLPLARAVAGGPAPTYGIAALAIVPFGAVGIPWNPWTAFFALAVITAAAAGLPILLGRFRDRDAEEGTISRGPALVVAAGVLLGAALIGLSAVLGLP